MSMHVMMYSRTLFIWPPYAFICILDNPEWCPEIFKTSNAIIDHIIHCFLFNIDSSRKNVSKKCLIASRHAWPYNLNTLPNQPKPVLLESLFSKIVTRWRASFIKVGACGIRVSRCLKEQLTWAINSINLLLSTTLSH